ncbi:MAG: BACON domain-containing protein, partial [Thermoanaerobaculia bacterium]
VQAVFDDECTTTSDGSTFRLGESNEDCPTNPQKATLVSPANGATNLASPVTFQWNAVPNATGYRVLASFGGEPFSLGTTSSTSLTAPVPKGSGFWIVQTFFGDDCPTTLSERRALTVTTGVECGTTGPALVSPANNATNVASPVTFQWNSVANAIGYRLFIATGDDGDFKFYGDTDGTSLARLVPEGRIRWYVVAVFGGCPETRSSTFTFFAKSGTDCPPATLTISSPAQGATTNSPVHAAWSAVANAEGYRVWVSIDGKAPVNVLRTTATEVDLQLPAGAMELYVEALRANCSPIVSDRRGFTVSQRTDCGQNVAPVLVSPAGTRDNPAVVNEGRVTLTWNAVANAIGYRVWLKEGKQGFQDIKLTKETQVTLDLDDDDFEWFVDALFEGCPPLSSLHAFFRVPDTKPRCASEKPVNVAPADLSIGESPVTFTWMPVENAEKYRVFVSIDGSEPEVIGVTEKTELTRPLIPGTIRWAVEAVFDECPSTFSDLTQFTIPEGQDCTEAGAELIAPANNATTDNALVDFVWAPVSGAIKYVLVAHVGDGAPTPIATTSDTHAERVVPAGRITWWVLTFFANCDPTESAQYVVTVTAQDCTTRRAILLSPHDERVSSPVHFHWTRVPNATGYNVWLRQGEEDASIVASTADTKAIVDLGEGTYEWFVESQFENCPPSESARAEFVVIPPVPCGTPEKPTAQVVGQALSNTQYKVRWTPLPNVRLYEIQESTSPDFANAETFTTDDTSFAFMHEVTGPPVQYLYRVRGVSDCSDDRGPFSDPIGVFITKPTTNNASAEIGGEANVVQKLFLPGSSSPLQFTATADKPWVTITPSSGTLPVEGITLNVTADPAALALGTNTVTIKVEYSGGSVTGPVSHASTTANIPLSVSLVTPILPTG